MNLLNQHPRLGILEGVNFFDQVLSVNEADDVFDVDIIDDIYDAHVNKMPSGAVINLPEKQIIKKNIAKQQTSGTLRQFYTEYLKTVSSSDIPGDKSNEYIFHLDKIRAMYPESKIIISVRDGRDYLSSYKNYITKGRIENNRVKKLYHPVTTSLLWKSSINSMLSFIHSDPEVHLQKYEALVQQPEREMKTLCDYLDIRFERKMLNPDFSNSSFNRKDNEIYSSSVGTWEKVLKDHEISIFERLNQRQLESLGYEVRGLNSSFSLQEIFRYVSFPFHSLKALWINRDSIPGPINFLRNRITRLLSG